MLVIVFIATLIISTIAAVKSDLTFGWLWLTFWPFHLCAFILFGAPAAVFAIIPARANSKYKKLIKQPYLILCDGKIVQSSQTYKSGNKLEFFCEYKADGEKRKIRVPKIIGAPMLKKEESNAKVVYDKTTTTVVVQKGKFPDVLKRFTKNDVI